MKDEIKIKINLLTKEGEASFIDRLVFFLLHYLRYIVVLTQITVIVVFFFRIMIDQEIIDLEEKINEKEEIIRISKFLIEDGKKYDFALKQVKIITDSQKNSNDYLNITFSSIPKGVWLENFTMTKEKISLSGFSRDPFLVRYLEQQLKKEERFDNVSVEKIIKLDFGYQFIINVKI